MRRLVVILAMGCGRLHFAPLVGDAAGGDAGGNAVADCWARWHDGSIAFEAPQLLTALSSAESDSDPFLTEDGLTLYFAREGEARVARRPDRSTPFTSSEVASDLDTVADELRITLTADALEVFISRRATTVDIFSATRQSTSDPFPAAAPVAAVTTNANDYDPHISRDGLRLYYAPAMSGMQQIVVASRSDRQSTFSAAVPFTDLPTIDGDSDPSLSPDERVILFTTRTAIDSTDLSYATRSMSTSAFSARLSVPDLNTSAREGHATLAADGCELYFASDQVAGGSIYDLYVARVL